ncbi:MAG: trehalase family glycosidase, partial [Bacteroidota bacterium]
MILEAVPVAPLDMEGAGIPEQHVQGLDLTYRAPVLSAAQRETLPAPILPARPDWTALYWRAWDIAFDKVQTPPPESGFKPFVDAAFSANVFQWDTCFMVAFLRYATDALPVYQTLDNFYAKQHADGFICREMVRADGSDFWPTDHPSAINPPLFADAEWALYGITGDTNRLRAVLPPLVRYYRWLQTHRRHADGIGYWTTALASGMDNTPRPYDQGGPDVHEHYGYAWLCMTAQQALSARRIQQIAEVVGEGTIAQTMGDDVATLHAYLNETLWNDDLALYVDAHPDGTPARVKTPATCWPLLAGATSRERAAAVARHLTDPASFWRTHAIPSVSADHEVFHPRGNYWHGGVWAPLVYLAMCAMDTTGHLDVAQRIAENHLDNVATVYDETGTFWESYAPEAATKSNIARPEFVGWTGCGPIAALIEIVLGIQVDAPSNTVYWKHTRAD